MVEKRLAGCVLMIPVGSIYRWKGKAVSEKEVLAVFKTTKLNAKKLSKLVEAHHPYEVPFVALIPLGQVNMKYMKWIKGEVRDPSTCSG